MIPRHDAMVRNGRHLNSNVLRALTHLFGIGQVLMPCPWSGQVVSCPAHSPHQAFRPLSSPRRCACRPPARQAPALSGARRVLQRSSWCRRGACAACAECVAHVLECRQRCQQPSGVRHGSSQTRVLSVRVWLPQHSGVRHVPHRYARASGLLLSRCRPGQIPGDVMQNTGAGGGAVRDAGRGIAAGAVLLSLPSGVVLPAG